ncbi:MAG: hypothetical protein HYV42_03425 [Candidatus Magasanikbacteria bacterium]|nr:hypothetical protein [Candidatus Magasanikbacteria bacterium]
MHPWERRPYPPQEPKGEAAAVDRKRKKLLGEKELFGRAVSLDDVKPGTPRIFSAGIAEGYGNVAAGYDIVTEPGEEKPSDADEESG